jgi:hypothetical protein
MAEAERIEQRPRVTSWGSSDIFYIAQGTEGSRDDKSIAGGYLVEGVENQWAPPGCSIYRTSTQAIANATDVALGFEDVGWGDESLITAGFPYPGFTIIVGGIYLCQAQVRWPSNATGVRSMRWRLNGSTYLGGIISNAVADANHVSGSVSLLLKLAAGNVLDVVVYQNSGSSLTLPGGKDVLQASILRMAVW